MSSIFRSSNASVITRQVALGLIVSLTGLSLAQTAAAQNAPSPYVYQWGGQGGSQPATVGQAMASPFAPQEQVPTPVVGRTIISGDEPDARAREPSDSEDGEEPSERTRRSEMEAAILKPPVPPGEFEVYVEKTLSRRLPRFGAALATVEAREFSPSPMTAIPPDYRLNPGDELQIGITGSIEADARVTIDSNGRIFLPRVGSISVVGTRFADLPALLNARVGEQFRNFKLSVSIPKLHGITVYVTGYAASPGAYSLTSLSTLVNGVIAAGGPASGGSFRTIELRRGSRLITTFDMYALLLSGDKTRDAALQDGDVIYIAPVGTQAAITGSVNVEAIYEAKPGENLGDLLRYAGGVSTLADESKTFVSRLNNLDTIGWQQLDLTAASGEQIRRGDILRITSVADYARPMERQAIVVKVEGEVARPGRYYLAPNSSVADLMAQVGGLTPRAFVYGAQIDRVSVQQQQQAGFDQALRDLQMAIASSPLTLRGLDTASQGAQASTAAIAQQVVEQMKSQKPSGRIILSVTPDSNALPAALVLENDDRIYVPPVPTTVGVFGSVYQQGSFVYTPSQTLGQYLRLAGGAKKAADTSDIFVVRANGSVLSRRQRSSGRGFDSEIALPGDVVFVPIRTTRDLWWERIVQATAVLSNLGIGAAAIKVLGE